MDRKVSFTASNNCVHTVYLLYCHCMYALLLQRMLFLSDNIYTYTGFRRQIKSVPIWDTFFDVDHHWNLLTWNSVKFLVMCQLLTLLALYTQNQNNTVGSTTLRGELIGKLSRPWWKFCNVYKKRWMGKCTEKVVKSD